MRSSRKMMGSFSFTGEGAEATCLSLFVLWVYHLIDMLAPLIDIRVVLQPSPVPAGPRESWTSHVVTVRRWTWFHGDSIDVFVGLSGDEPYNFMFCFSEINIIIYMFL